MRYRMFVMGGICACVARVAFADMYSDLDNVYKNNPVIAGARSAVAGADADLDTARSGYRPYLGVAANVGAAHTELMGTDFDYMSSQFGVQLQQNVYQGGAIIAQVKAARGVLASQQAMLYSVQQDVLLDAINAYINVLNSEHVRDLNKNNLRVLERYYEFVSDNESVGNLTRTDVSQASARVAQAKYGVAQADSQYENTIETVRRIYGGVPDKFSEIDTTRMDDVFPDDLDDALEYALGYHPVLRALDAQEAAARENITIARKSRMPSIDVRASAMQFEDLPIINRARDGRVGVYLSMPLYDRGASASAMASARFTVDGIGEKIKDARRMIVENLTQAWNIYATQTSAIAAARASVDASIAALDGVRDQQRRGRRTVLDVLNAEQELLDARVTLTRAKHSKISAYFAILAAMGCLSPENLGLDTSEQ